MYSILTDIKNYLHSIYPGYRVDFCYEDVAAERPVVRKELYLMPTKLNESRLEFALYVYSPVKLGGDECVRTAYDVYSSLLSGGFEMVEASLGAVKYDNKSQGFLVQITGTFQREEEPVEEPVEEPIVEPESIDCIMTYEAFGREFSLSFSAEKYKVFCDAEEYPILTICDSSPIDIIEGRKNYRITIEGIAFDEAVGNLYNQRMYKLCFSDDNMLYEQCKFDKYEKSEENKFTVTVTAANARKIVTD